MLTVEKVCKIYPPKLALREISFSLASGECLVLLGPNGAGKTTLLKILSTLESPSSGSLSLFDANYLGEREKIKSHLSILLDQAFCYPDLTVVENLSLYAALYGLTTTRCEECLELLDLKKVALQPFKTLSRGMQQRVGLARALLPSTKLLLLDEPFVGLDTDTVSLFIKTLNQMKHTSRSIIISTHNFPEAELVGDRFLILKEGKKVFLGKKEDLTLGLANTYHEVTK